MKIEDRKAAIAAYKERKSAAGVFAIRCAATGGAWVGRSLSLDTVQNRRWFALRMGTHAAASLQQAWREHGPEGLSFEAVERLAEEQTTYGRDALMKARAAHWRVRLGAEPV